MDMCATVLANGAPFAARASALEPGLDELLARALSHRGFALVDVWELCTAFYAADNKLSRKALGDLSARLRMPFGVVLGEPRPELTDTLGAIRDRTAVRLPPRSSGGIAPRFPHRLPSGSRVELVLAGSAGFKVRSAAAAFAAGGMLSGLSICQKDDYPITVKTGHSVSELVLSDREIRYTGVKQPDGVVVLTAEGLKMSGGFIKQLGPAGLLYIAAGLPVPETRAAVVTLALTASCLPPTLWALAALARALSERGWFPLEALRAAVGLSRRPQAKAEGERAIDKAASL